MVWYYNWYSSTDNVLAKILNRYVHKKVLASVLTTTKRKRMNNSDNAQIMYL